MTEFERVLMTRDGMSASQAAEEKALATEMLHDALENGDLDVAYEVCGEWGLEPDYLIGLL